MKKIEKFWRDVLRTEDEGLLRTLSGQSHFVRISKGEVIVRQGEMQAWITLIVEGVFKGCYLDGEGKEIVDCFGFRPGEPAMACQRFDEPAEISVEAVTDSLCVRLSTEVMRHLCDQWPQLFQVYDMYLMQGIMKHREMKNVLSEMGLEERYCWFLREYPGLIDVVRHKDIASFLNVTPEGFSRMRKNLKKETMRGKR